MANRLGNNGGRSYDFLAQPVRIDCAFTVAPTNPLGITGLIGNGVKNAFMYSSAPAANNPLTVNASKGFAYIQLRENYYRYAGSSFEGIVSPPTGSSLAINSTALTVGQPYIISSVGVGPAGAVTIAPQGDTAGSLASSWFRLYDAYGNTYIMWIYVTGVGGTYPSGVSGIPVQVTIASGAAASAVTTAIANAVATISNGIPPGVVLPAGVAPFTASGGGTATLTLTSTGNSLTIPGPPSAGVIAGTAWTFAQTVYNTNAVCWRGVGLPPGITPAVNASFVATATGFSTGGGSTGTVQVPGVSGVNAVELVGDPNTTLNALPVAKSPNIGGWVMVQFLAPTSSSVTTSVPAAPATGSIIRLQFIVEAKGVLISGE